LSNTEVDNHSLTEDFRTVGGVSQLGDEAHLEVAVVFDLLVTHSQDFDTSFLSDVLLQDRVDNGIKLSIETLEEDRLSELNGVL
jgi:hypothetical protein